MSRHSRAQARDRSARGPTPRDAPAPGIPGTPCPSGRACAASARPAPPCARRGPRPRAPPPSPASAHPAAGSTWDCGNRARCRWPACRRTPGALRGGGRARAAPRAAPSPPPAPGRCAKQPAIVARLRRYMDSIALAAAHSSRSTARRRIPSSSAIGSRCADWPTATENVTTGICPSPPDSFWRPICTGPSKWKSASSSAAPGASACSRNSVTPPRRTATYSRSPSTSRSDRSRPEKSRHEPGSSLLEAAEAARSARFIASHWPRSATACAAAISCTAGCASGAARTTPPPPGWRSAPPRGRPSRQRIHAVSPLFPYRCILTPRARPASPEAPPPRRKPGACERRPRAV
jgi:hypothetical protein